MALLGKPFHTRNRHVLSAATSQSLDRLATHPLWGVLILLAILGVALWITYRLALPAAAWLQHAFSVHVGGVLRQLLAAGPLWLERLVVEGMLGGVGTVISFVPVLLVFFSMIALLEDSGYMSRAALVTDRYLQRMGLPGKACVPLCMGFGCNTPAVLGCRILSERRSRLLTMMLVPLVPCTSRLAVITFLAPLFFGQRALLVTWGLVVLNLAILGLTGMVIRRLMPSKTRLSEPDATGLTPYRVPSILGIGRQVFHNTLEFLSKMGILVVFSALIWGLSSFPLGQPEQSLLAQIGKALLPLGQWMGIHDWRLIVALLASFAAKENTLAVMGVLFPVVAGGPTLSQQVAAALPGAAGIAFLVVQMLFVPCIATVTAIRHESGSWKYALLAVNFSLILSLLLGTSAYWLANILSV